MVIVAPFFDSQCSFQRRIQTVSTYRLLEHSQSFRWIFLTHVLTKKCHF